MKERSKKYAKTHHINDPTSYHLQDLESLGWELTVCNSLENKDSPCRHILKDNNTFGNLLYKHLEHFLNWDKIVNVIEVGGGYGYLMRDFLEQKKFAQVMMLDLSLALLQEQKKNLSNGNLEFKQKDFLEVNFNDLKNFDLAIFNENLGDFPTVCQLDLNFFSLPLNKLDNLQLEVKKFFKKYSLPMPHKKIFNFNLGAIKALEKTCQAGLKYIYLSEHSCEVASKEKVDEKFKFFPTGDPEQIKLKGHDEYTLKFSYLEKVARSFGYQVKRGQFVDFIKIVESDRLNFILNSDSQKDEHEIIRHFVYDLYKYEYLILIK
jgi:hypothetical protein